MTALPELDEHAALLEALHDLCARLPVPDGRWHPHVAAIAACRADFASALSLVADDPEALRLLDRLVDGAAAAEFDPARSPELAAAWERLDALPVPEGRHPFLDEIMPALDAYRLLLIALSRFR